ncbi:MAG: hypothetical protein KC619_28505 [Myxococcales bacterium]|nr:hypothetical protein [Myxococcales bacterium]
MLAIVVCAVGALPAQAQDDVQENDARIERALRRYRAEPSAEWLVRAAVAARSATPGRVRDAMDRARATGWLPTATGGVRRGQAIDLRALTGTTTPANVSTGDDLVLEARLVFRFDRIVFAPEEPRLLRELRATEAAEAELTVAVVSLYFERRRLQLEADLSGTIDLARRVRILEIEALLDAFTGGTFHRIMNRRRGDP